MSDRDLKALERRTFRVAYDDGLWDVLIAAFVAMFAVAPLLSEQFGDFWSSAVFVPIWIGTYLTIHVIRTTVVIPRIGTVGPGPQRARRMRRFSFALLVIYAVAFAAGIAVAAAVATDRLDPDGLAYPIAFGVAILVGFSVGAYTTGVIRFAAYGLMLAAAPLIGEWLWRNDLVDHHGYPVVFGTVAALIFAIGVIRFAKLVRSHPVPPNTSLV